MFYDSMDKHAVMLLSGQAYCCATECTGILLCYSMGRHTVVLLNGQAY